MDDDVTMPPLVGGTWARTLLVRCTARIWTRTLLVRCTARQPNKTDINVHFVLPAAESQLRGL